MTTPPAPARLTWPSAERNKDPILAELQRLLPTAGGRLLEVASGSGQHAVHCAAALPRWEWLPSDPDAAMRASVADWAALAALPNLRPVLDLDLLAPQPWPDALTAALAGPFDALFNANMLHISPWPTCAALMQLAARCLAPAGLLITYGPYLVQGEPVAEGNARFDADLRARNPDWGVRWLHEVAAVAQQQGLALRERVAMPANNLLLVFGRQRVAAA